jgi:menaquinone-9 beta-reductase
MSDRHFSVAVIGAGPAGASCAISLLRSGVTSIALVDKAKFPRDKSCGDGIGPGAVQMMRQLGLGSMLERHLSIRYLSVSGPSGVRARGPLPPVGGAPPIGYTIPRLEFDNYLFEGALHNGAFDLTGQQLENADFSDGRWLLTLKDMVSGIRSNITADMLVGADGARSKVRRLLGVPMNSDRHTGTAVRIYAEAEKGNFDALQIDFDKSLLPAYGWLFPIDKKRANIGIGMDLDNYKKKKVHLEELLDSYKKSLNGGIVYDDSSYSAYILPYGSEMPRLAHPGKKAALIGDAGSMINPLTGEGIFYGMFAGELLGSSIAPHLCEQTSRVKFDLALMDFESQFRRRFTSHYRTNWSMKEKVEVPWWCDMVVNACKKDQVVLATLIDLMMGDKEHIDIGVMMRIGIRNIPFFA